jgi:hypothetical protein
MYKLMISSLLAMGLGLGLAACSAPATEEAPVVTTPGEDTEATCLGGTHRSCYAATGDCGCCPTGKVLDCFSPGDCYCCSGRTCM